MFINKSNQLYKPRRILYYIDADEHSVAAFRKGELPDEIRAYANAFGTYDDPGIFFIEGQRKAVIGIEFRESDERIRYPEKLKSAVLGESYFYSVEIDNAIELTAKPIRSLFEKLAMDKDAHRLYSDLTMKEGNGVIGVFSAENGRKLRLHYEWKISEDRARRILHDEVEEFDPKVLYRMAFVDEISGAYNWNHLVSFLEMPEEKGIRDYAFVHFDVKEFRIINEVYGHNTANRVLQNIARAMEAAEFVYASARCHNDNFAMLIRDMTDEETGETLKKFFDELSHLEEDPHYRIRFRAGVVPMKRSMALGNRVADAGKLAQALGTSPDKTDIVFYDEKTHADILWGNYIKAYLDTAVENDEFVVYLQPKFDIAKEKIKGAEALIRWNYRNEEFLPPSRFVPFFEKDGSIGKIDDIVLDKVCAAFAKWKREGKALYPISVNLSRSRLYAPDLIDHLTGIADSYGVDHSLIDFELTESATYDNKERMLSVLGSLRERGFGISMDDFGTGYSSLSLLTEMPLDTLKIDKSFVDKIGMEQEREKDVVVIRHIIALARELHFVCLAEGAEEKSQVDRLRDLGCEIIQGYYYSRPIPLNEYEQRYLCS